MSGKLEPFNRLYLPIILFVQIPFRRTDMRMAHQRLHRPEIGGTIEKGRGERVSHHVRVDSFPNQCLLCHGFDEAVNGGSGESP